ncbi:Maf family protein [Wenyingzhuangia aestuarii]|uniref:hypothetical protein n=1 Tax=Wenyingzhuangia aestuarii TaxID=1647582 RepID=UPI00143C66E2|nr:hypothetical protein [Wenyingzhuangia aestuarii]NJB83334.1 uncharacterized protein YcfL [Wenyingzhuangia aestuarii]
MKKIAYLFATALLCVVFSCSEDTQIEENPEETLLVTTEEIKVNTILLNKNELFVKDVATLDINTNNVDVIEVKSTASALSIVKISSTSYQISSNEVLSAPITITLKNKAETINEVLSIKFNKHGTEDFLTFEGITLDDDTSGRIKQLHGEPGLVYSYETKETVNGITTTYLYEDWFYFDKGFVFSLLAGTKGGNTTLNGWIHEVYIYIEPTNFNLNGTIYPMDPYSYLDNLGQLSSNNSITMDKVIEIFGTPTTKSSYNNETSSIRYYQYRDHHAFNKADVTFRFNSDDIENYQGKNVNKITIW